MLLEEHEQVLAVVRRHWFVLLLKIITPVLLMLFPFVLAPILTHNVIVADLLSALALDGSVTSFFGALWILFMWMLLFYGWTDYYLDIWTITNIRVIAIDQKGLFRRSIASFRYERLQDVNIEIHGLIATFLDFGSLEVQTAGHGESEFLIHGVPRPREVKAKILEAADARVKNVAATGRLSSDGV